jgi:hypothetical protein
LLYQLGGNADAAMKVAQWLTLQGVLTNPDVVANPDNFIVSYSAVDSTEKAQWLDMVKELLIDETDPDVARCIGRFEDCYTRAQPTFFPRFGDEVGKFVTQGNLRPLDGLVLIGPLSGLTLETLKAYAYAFGDVDGVGKLMHADSGQGRDWDDLF